jgi:sulfoxide reductase heme-binding subunit YedZ
MNTRSWWLGLVAFIGGTALFADALPLLGLVGVEAPLGWWIARTAGLVAYVALWFSVTFGVFVGARGAGVLHAPTLINLHESWASVAVFATALHVVFVFVDPASNVGWVAGLFPGLGAPVTGGVVLGTGALWAFALLIVSTALRARLPSQVWRAVHASAFGSFLMALAHGAFAGTDAGDPVVRGLYLGTFASLVGAVFARVAVAVAAADRPARP